MVKRFLVFVKDLKNAAERSRQIIPEKLQEKLLNANEKQPFVPEDGIRNLMGNDEVMAELPGTSEVIRVFQNFGDRLKSEPERLRQDLISLAEKLPQASRTFFIKELTAPAKKSNNSARKLDKKHNEKSNAKEIRRGGALLCALMFQCMFQGLYCSIEKNVRNRELLNNIDFILTFFSLMDSLISQLAFQNTIQELLSKGDDESLLKAVRINKSIVCTDILKHRIARAQFSGDTMFLKKLGNNIAYNPLEKEALYSEAYVVLRTFWIAGLNLLKPKDMANFLKDCGIVHTTKPESLKRFIERHIHPIYGK